jgi:glycosyltransferase involved in cell wall biosynthesis
MDPLVTIVIPHFNRAALLAQTVNSVRASSFAQYEIVVVDDGSDPSPRADIEQLAGEDLRILDRDGKKGPSRSRNIGAHAARSEFLIFLDSDDLMAPWCLEQRFRTTRESSANDLWIFPVLLFEEKPGDKSTLWNVIGESENDALRFVQSDAPWHTSSPIWRRDTFLELGGFNENVMYGDDADLHLRAVLAGLSIARFPSALPDVFVRRSNEDRITSGLTDAIAESRLVRLREGTSLLQQRKRADLLSVFEGQYFVEAEFLLFNAPNPAPLIARVLEQWREDYPHSRHLKPARRYLWLGLATRERGFLILRMARRAIRSLVPQAFFPSGGLIEAATASQSTMKEITARLENAAS